MYRKSNKVSANSRINRLSSTSAVSQPQPRASQYSPPKVASAGLSDAQIAGQSSFKVENEVRASAVVNDPRQQNPLALGHGFFSSSRSNNNNYIGSSLEAGFPKQQILTDPRQHPALGFDGIGASGLGAQVLASGRRVVPVGDPFGIAEAGLRNSSSVSLMDISAAVGTLDQVPRQFPNKVWIRTEVETAAKRPRLGTLQISRGVPLREAPPQPSQSTASSSSSTSPPRCICDRPLSRVCCSFCGHLNNGVRARRGCLLHPNIVYLMDLTECPSCKAPCPYLHEFCN